MLMTSVFTLPPQLPYSATLTPSMLPLLPAVSSSPRTRAGYSLPSILPYCQSLPLVSVSSPLCRQYLYLGAPMHIPRSTPGQRSHPVVQDLVNRLQKRLAPLRWLTNNAAGISIPVATAIYVTFIRSVVDYLSPALSQLPRASLQPLETFQNEAMRVILGCHVSTRIVNMRTELNLPPITERIYSMVTCFTLKCLHSPRITPYYSQVIRHALGQRPRVPPIQPGGRTLVRTICSIIRRLDIDVPEEDDVPGPPPWLQFSPEVCYTPTSKAALPVL